MAAQWQDLEENFFTCSICLDYFKEPKQLPCLHKFCRECLKPVVERSGGEFPCPLCKRHCDVPDGRIDELVTDFHSKAVIEYIQQQKSQEASKSQKSEQPAKSEGDKDPGRCQDQASTARNTKQPVAVAAKSDAEGPRTQNSYLSVGDNKLCTFTKTQKTYTPQVWYFCFTCNLVDRLGACVVCANVCHDGHVLSAPRYSARFFCDCGTEEYCQCKALVERIGRSSARSERTEDPGRPGTQDPQVHVPDNAVCTFTKTGKKYTPQVWYQCYTCYMVGQLGTCVVCAGVCHNGHDLSAPRFSAGFFCDCGTGEYCLCKALVKRNDGSPSGSEEENSGRLGIQNPRSPMRDNMVCTFAKTGKKPTPQEWYECSTCNLVDKLGICVVCASVCHDGHVLSGPHHAAGFFCDCGTGEYCQCKALVKRTSGSSADSERRIDSGRPGTWMASDSDDRLCTFTRTRRNHTAQVWYHCYTCGLVGRLGACAVCAKVCHKDHRLSDAKFSSWFFCDCGTEEYCPCKCLGLT